VPGWSTSLLLPVMLRGLVYRMPLAPTARASWAADRYFKTTNRYRDLAVGPDQRTFYIVTDTTAHHDDTGTPVARANPGAISNSSTRARRRQQCPSDPPPYLPHILREAVARVGDAERPVAAGHTFSQ
jgi:hypothetical protein